MDSSEISRKRKKYQSGKTSNNTPEKQKLSGNSNASSVLFKKKKSFPNKYADFQNPEKHGKSNKSMNKNMTKTMKRDILKTSDVANTKSQSAIQSKTVLKSKKIKKFKKAPGTNIQVSSSLTEEKSLSPAVKKVKKGKKQLRKLPSDLEENIESENDEELSEVSDDNESDEEVLREEIQNSSIFKQIEKLMKKAPHLNPANAGLKSPEDLNDEDVDNSSDLSLSWESGDENSDKGTDNLEVSSSESELEDSNLKKETATKRDKTSVNSQDKNVLPAKKNNFSENVAESSGFNRTSKDNALKRNISEKFKKSEMSSNLKNKVQEKLAGAKFRFLNEKLYTETGKEAFKYFQENTEEYEDYHSGYRLQVSKWPINPVNEIIADIQKLKKSLVIADLGCGEAKIAQTFPNRTVHSFDLVPLNEFVKACDISKIPLPNESVDVVVFCLSLMGTNLKDYLCEAFRILKIGGILKIAEVESRIEDLGHFINYLKSIGFKVERKNTKHKMFVFLDLKKEMQKCKIGKIPSLSLRPCLYKKR